MRYLDKKFRKNKIRYIFQAIMGGLAVAVALVFFDVVNKPVIIASFGASAFIAFAMPHHEIARPRYLIGGYCVGVIVGCLIHYATFLPVGSYLAEKILYVIAGGMSVGLAMFMMTITNTEHAPATGIALGFVINEWTFKTVVLVLVGIIIISTIQRCCRNWMINLI
jgi:CBS-domain-containing membrane protein